jgi:hypothetical protein
MRRRSIVICGPHWFYRIFAHYFIKRTIFGKKYNEYDFFFLLFCNLCLKYISHFKRNLDLNVNFLNRFSKNPHVSNLMKIRPLGVVLFLACGQLIMAFRDFATASRNCNNII